jgi:hypothetical protein
MTRRLNGNGLPVTSRIYDQVGRKSGTINSRLDLTAIHATGHASGNIATGFAPASGERSAFRNDVAIDVKPVTVARAAQALLQPRAILAHVIVSPAAQAFTLAAGQSDKAAARPTPA